MSTCILRLACLTLKCLSCTLPSPRREENYAEWSGELQPIWDASGAWGRLGSTARVLAYCAGHCRGVWKLRRVYRGTRSVYEARAWARARTLVWVSTLTGAFVGLAGGEQWQHSRLITALTSSGYPTLGLGVIWAVMIPVAIARLTRILERRAARRRVPGGAGE